MQINYFVTINNLFVHPAVGRDLLRNEQLAVEMYHEMHGLMRVGVVYDLYYTPPILQQK